MSVEEAAAPACASRQYSVKQAFFFYGIVRGWLRAASQDRLQPLQIAGRVEAVRWLRERFRASCSPGKAPGGRHARTAPFSSPSGAHQALRENPCYPLATLEQRRAHLRTAISQLSRLRRSLRPPVRATWGRRMCKPWFEGRVQRTPACPGKPAWPMRRLCYVP